MLPQDAGGAPCPHTLDADGSHEHLCSIGGAIDARHTALRTWVAEKLGDAEYGGTVAVEQPVAPPEVNKAGRVDVVCRRGGQRLLVGVAVASCATTYLDELARRRTDANRALRQAERRKSARYGDHVLAVAVEDTGRVGGGTRRLLRELAEQQEEETVAVAYRKLLADVQAVVLAATAAVLQSAHGLPPTPG